MTEKIYILRFVHRDSSEIEEQEYTRLADAWESFRIFAEPASAEIYRRVELIEYTCPACREFQIAAIDFTAHE